MMDKTQQKIGTNTFEKVDNQKLGTSKSGSWMRVLNVDSLYPSGMADSESIYPQCGTGCAFTGDMAKDLNYSFNTKTLERVAPFLQEKKHYNHEDKGPQNIPAK